MGQLPFHVERDHLPEIRGRNGVVLASLAFGFVERAAKRLARQPDAGGMVKRNESVEPMLTIAIEGAAHVEKDRANHSGGSLPEARLARNLRSALRCQNQRRTKARFIATRTKAKNKSIRCRQTRTPTAKNRVLSPRKFQPRTSG